ncbi:TIGR04222 domain-containing membrane protein [Methylobacterium brachythecii]|nr:TIGR04222 domain-containing membrane protein [Methylobacterium brachythecii]
MVDPGSVHASADMALHEVERVAWTSEQRDLFQRIETHPFERPDHILDFTGRLARDRGWSLDFARGAVAEYRRFCFLAMVFETPVTPSEEVDEVWHQHLTYSRDYWEAWCGSVLRQRLHHDPTEGGPSEQGRYRMQYAETLARYEAFFGPPDQRYWPATHDRFRGRPRYRIVDGDRVLTLRRPAWRGWFARAGSAIVLAAAGLCATPRPASAIPLGVLDWTAGPFLTLYANLIVAGLMLALIGRAVLVSGGRAPTAPNLDPVELALLAGGNGRAADAVIIGLIDAGAASFSTGSGDITVEEQGVRLPRILEPYRGVVAGTVKRKTLVAALAPRLEVVRETLVRSSLVPSQDVTSRIKGWTLLCVAPVFALGLTKIFVGLSRGKPVGFLFAMSLVFLVLTVFALVKAPKRTRAGDRVLSGFRQRHARAARAPLEGELLFAFALGGAAILAGTPYEAYGRHLRAAGDGSSGCGSSGGDGGGSGCGGGGCGGCGGGGD